MEETKIIHPAPEGEETPESNAESYLGVPNGASPHAYAASNSTDGEVLIDSPISFSDTETPDAYLDAEPVEETSSDASHRSSALPALIVPQDMSVYMAPPPDPKAWRRRAMSHAGSAIAGAAVTLAAVAATVGLQPKNKEAEVAKHMVALNPPPAETNPNLNGMTPGMPVDPNAAPGMTPGAPPVGPNGAVPPGMGMQGAPPPGSPRMPPGQPGAEGTVPPGTMAPAPGTMGTPPGSMPQGRVPGAIPRGAPLEGYGGRPLPPLPNTFKLPPLTPVMPNGARAFPPLPPGVMPNSPNRPPYESQPLPPMPTQRPGAMTARIPSLKGPTAPPARAGSNRASAPPMYPAATATAQTPEPREEDTDTAITRVSKTVGKNPNDAASQLQLEKLYRQKMIQVDKVDDMERYRSMAEDARDKARHILDDGKPASKPAPSTGGDATKPATDSSKTTGGANPTDAKSTGDTKSSGTTSPASSKATGDDAKTTGSAPG